MSLSRPSQCLICTFSRTVSRSTTARRKFHASATQLARKPRHKSIKAADLPTPASQLPKSKSYTKDELDALSERYTPAQLAVVKAAESSIPSHFNRQAGHRAGQPWTLKYIEDFAEVDPVLDKPIRSPYSNTDPEQRLKDEDELDEDLAKFVQDFPEGDGQEDAFLDFEKNLRLTVGKPEAELDARSAAAAELFHPGEVRMDRKLPKAPKPKLSGGQQAEEASPALVRLMQMTGYNANEIASLRVKSIIMHRVVNQTRLGKIGKMYILSIAGNEKGLIGIGEGKAEESDEARLQSQYRAIRNMQPIIRYEGRTIFGDVKGKVSATELELYARPPGFGLRCQQYIWEICKCAGIADLAARVNRSRNPMNTVKATVQALLSQKHPEDIARARGKKLVDVRKVYYAGLV